MKFIAAFRGLSKKQKEETARILVDRSTPDFDFYLMVVLSVLMATFGLITNSESVVIGSMLIAPVMSPILALSLGLVANSEKLIYRTAKTLFKITIFSIVTAFVATLVFSFSYFDLNEAILSRTTPGLIHFAVAIVAGLAVSYSFAKPELSEALPGVAIAVALMPPLAVVGIGLAHTNADVFAGALLLYLINVAGIILVNVFAFFMMDFTTLKGVIDTEIANQQKRLEQEQELAEEAVEEFKEEILTTKSDTLDSANSQKDTLNEEQFDSKNN